MNCITHPANNRNIKVLVAATILATFTIYANNRRYYTHNKITGKIKGDLTPFCKVPFKHYNRLELMTKNKTTSSFGIMLKAFISCDLTSRHLKRNLKLNFAADAADVIMERLRGISNDSGSVVTSVAVFLLLRYGTILVRTAHVFDGKQVTVSNLPTCCHFYRPISTAHSLKTI